MLRNMVRGLLKSQRIETTLRQMVPAVQGIMDVTDHAAGADPYFAQSKK